MIGVASLHILNLKSKRGVSEILAGVIVSFTIVSLTLIVYGLSVPYTSSLIGRGVEALADESILALAESIERLEFKGESKLLELPGFSYISIIYTENLTLFANGALIGEWRGFEIVAFTSTPMSANNTVLFGGCDYFSLNGSCISAVKYNFAIKLLFGVQVSSFGNHLYVRVYTIESAKVLEGGRIRIAVTSALKSIYNVPCPHGRLKLILVSSDEVRSLSMRVRSGSAIILFEILKLEVR